MCDKIVDGWLAGGFRYHRLAVHAESIGVPYSDILGAVQRRFHAAPRARSTARITCPLCGGRVAPVYYSLSNERCRACAPPRSRHTLTS